MTQFAPHVVGRFRAQGGAIFGFLKESRWDRESGHLELRRGFVLWSILIRLVSLMLAPYDGVIWLAKNVAWFRLE